MVTAGRIEYLVFRVMMGIAGARTSAPESERTEQVPTMTDKKQIEHVSSFPRYIRRDVRYGSCGMFTRCVRACAEACLRVVVLVCVCVIA